LANLNVEYCAAILKVWRFIGLEDADFLPDAAARGQQAANGLSLALVFAQTPNLYETRGLCDDPKKL
jgi:hypothetical protein